MKKNWLHQSLHQSLIKNSCLCSISRSMQQRTKQRAVTKFQHTANAICDVLYTLIVFFSLKNKTATKVDQYPAFWSRCFTLISINSVRRLLRNPYFFLVGMQSREKQLGPRIPRGETLRTGRTNNNTNTSLRSRCRNIAQPPRAHFQRAGAKRHHGSHARRVARFRRLKQYSKCNRTQARKSIIHSVRLRQPRWAPCAHSSYWLIQRSFLQPVHDHLLEGRFALAHRQAVCARLNADRISLRQSPIDRALLMFVRRKKIRERFKGGLHLPHICSFQINVCAKPCRL